MMGFWDGSGISWTICKQFAPCSKQITTPTPHQVEETTLLISGGHFSYTARIVDFL